MILIPKIICTLQRAEDDKYLGFLVSEDGTGAGTVGELLEYIEKRGIDITELELIAGDGTNANTGFKVCNQYL